MDEDENIDPMKKIMQSEDLIERLQKFAEELRAKHPSAEIDEALDRIYRWMIDE